MKRIQHAKAAVSELDSILDQALDDFDEQEMNEKVAEVINTRNDYDDEAKATSEEQRQAEVENMRALISQINNPGFAPTQQTTLKSLSTTEEGNETVDDLFEQLTKQCKSAGIPSVVPTNPDDSTIQTVDRQVAGTLHMLGTAQEGMEGMEASKLEEAGETMREDMVGIFSVIYIL